MEPTHETEPQNTELPSPVAPQMNGEASIGQAPEAAYAEAPLVQSATNVSQDGQLPVAPALPASDTGAINGATPVATIATDDNAMIADDADLIEKEWVTRAKAIVEQTKENPFEQNKAINKVKVEYIKKRYNKDLKASEG